MLGALYQDNAEKKIAGSSFNPLNLHFRFCYFLTGFHPEIQNFRAVTYQLLLLTWIQSANTRTLLKSSPEFPPDLLSASIRENCITCLVSSSVVRLWHYQLLGCWWLETSLLGFPIGTAQAIELGLSQVSMQCHEQILGTLKVVTPIL